MGRYVGLAILFFGTLIPLRMLDRPADGTGDLAGGPSPAVVHEEAERALAQGRYWRASQILQDYLAVVPDPGAGSILLSAEAAAGRGDWLGVERLLAGRAWLDTAEGGRGWRLVGRSRFELGRWLDSAQSLARYLEVASGADDRERGLVLVARAMALAEAGDAAGAIATYDEAAERLPRLADWLTVRAAEAAARVGDTAEVRRRLESTDPVLAREWGWRVRVEARQAAGDVAGALRAAEFAANRLRDAERRAEAWSVTGELRRMRGDHAGARAAFVRAMEAAPESPGAVMAARWISAMPGATPRDMLRAGRVYLRHGNVERGIAGLEAYLAGQVGSPVERAEVRLELARALSRAGRHRDAEQLLLALADEAPTARIGAAALFEAGRVQYRQGRAADGRATYLRAAQRFPDQRAAAEALFLVADLDHDAGRLESARRHYRTVVAIRPDIDQAGLAMMRLGGMAFAEGDHAGAARIFEAYRSHHPDGRRYQQATYWAARAYLASDKPEAGRERLRQVRRADPFSFYGVRAGDLLGEAFWNVPLDASPPVSPRLDREIRNAFARLDLLGELGWTAAADFELDRLRSHYLTRDGALYALAEAFNARGYTFTGVRLGWEIFRREGVWNTRLLRIIYPFPYRELIVAEARGRGIDPYLAAGLIRQESMFQPAIQSHAGAIGLMQIMPATGRGLARAAGLNPFDPAMLEQPELNVRLGMEYLQELIRAYDGRLIPALAAYNAGPHRVSQWRRFPEWSDEELFAERIPFAETREYVKIVRRNARVYAELYGPAHAAAGVHP